MSWRFNPFTGTLDYFDESELDVKFSFSEDFLITDWVLSAGVYTYNAQHNLESDKINVAIFENGNEEVIVDRVQIVDNNNVKLYVSYSPDCRFDGRINIFKVQE